MKERGISTAKVAATLQKVRHRLAEYVARSAKIVVPEYGQGCAPLIQCNSQGSTVITVLDYPGMLLPPDVEVVDWRAGLKDKSPKPTATPTLKAGK